MERDTLKLFLVSTRGLGDYYVVEKSFNDAKDKLNIMLSEAGYGISPDRLVTGIKLLSQEIYEFPKGKPFFSSNEFRLILPTTCNNLNE